MGIQKISVVSLASAIAIAGLGVTSSDAYAGSFSEGTCSLTNVLAGNNGASACGNFTGNDSRIKFIDYLNGLNGKSIDDLPGYGSGDSTFAAAVSELDGTWSLLGKSDEGGDAVNSTTGGEQSGQWSLTESLKDPFVVVLKASNYYSAYLFKDYDAAVQSGTFNVKGITANSKNASKFANLSHLSVYSFAPRPQEVESPTIPEPTALLGLLAVVAVGYRTKRSVSA